MPLPQLDSARLVPRVLPCLATEGRRHMGAVGAAGAVARLRPLGHVSVSTPTVGPHAGSCISYQNPPTPNAAVEKDLCQLVGHGRGPQLGSGRHVGRIANLARALEGLHYFAGSHLTNARVDGVQIGNLLGGNPRRIGPHAHPRRHSRRNFPLCAARVPGSQT